MKEPLVYIIILNWNGKDDTLNCLKSLIGINYKNHEIIVVDNGSKDDSVRIIRKKFPSIKIIKNKRNLGYAEGNNIGIRYALRKGADYVLLLNNDTIVKKDFLIELIRAICSNEKIGIVGPLVYYFNSSQIQLEGINKISTFKKFLIATKKSSILSPPLSSISGCAMLIKKEVLKKVGLLDSDYYLYYEDTDFCSRVIRAGYSIHISPKSIIFHKNSASSNKVAPIKFYYIARNRFIFTKKNMPSKRKFVFITRLLLIDTLKIILGLILKEKDIVKLKYFLGGIYSGFCYMKDKKLVSPK